MKYFLHKIYILSKRNVNIIPVCVLSPKPFSFTSAMSQKLYQMKLRIFIFLLDLSVLVSVVIIFSDNLDYYFLKR